MTPKPLKKWIVAQLGARENYAVARSLYRRGLLDALVTDLWTGRTSLMGAVSQRIRERYHVELDQAPVMAPSITAVVREFTGRLSNKSGWDLIIKRNEWFQKVAARQLQLLEVDEDSVVFAYSYAAEQVLKTAKQKGATTILGQIDPALAEARLVSKIHERSGTSFEAPPERYWAAWRRETELADIILVNSEWSREGLCQEGVSADRIRVIPLAAEFQKSPPKVDFPNKFTTERPLKLLFLGQVNLRKGIDLLLQAIAKLQNKPIQLDVVGPQQVSIPDEALNDDRIRFHGSVPRGLTQGFYRQADVFVFPTRSDGFGLTQLEALAAGVPVLASKFCGNVVEDGSNGLLLPELTVESIADVIEQLCEDPSIVARLSTRAILSDKHGVDALGQSLVGLVDCIR